MRQNIFITGSSRGFGQLMARTLLAQGHTVVATMRQPQGRNQQQAHDLRTFAAGHNGRLHIIDLDVTNDEAVETAVQQAMTQVNHLDVVINNAGIGDGFAAYTETVPVTQFQRIFDVNLFGVQRVMRAVLPVMRRQQQGLLLNISSTMGRIVLPFAAAYTATKYALEGLCESYRYELAGSGIEVVMVEPGGFGTEFWANLEPAADTARAQSYGILAALPQKMYGGMDESLNGASAPNPQAVANAVLKLIETAPGQRPFRTVVDPLMGGHGPTTINEVTDKVQTQLLDGLGMAQLLQVKVPV